MISIEELVDQHKTLCTTAREISTQRGKEYAPDEDTLATFREAASMYGCKPSDVARMQLCLKIARLKHEYKPDTTYDLINYAIYHSILIEDEEIE